MRRVPSQDHVSTPPGATSRLRGFIGATSQLPAALTSHLSRRVGGAHGSSVLPGIVRWCSHKPVRLTLKVGGRAGGLLHSCGDDGGGPQRCGSSCTRALLPSPARAGLPRRRLIWTPTPRPSRLQAASGVYGMLTAQHLAEPPPPGERPQLDWRPRLSALQEALCFGAAALVCAAFYAATAPRTINPLYGAAVALLCSSVAGALRYSLLEAMYRCGPPGAGVGKVGR
jgi:hypothetical protein